MKKKFAVVLAFVMVLAMCTTVFADNTGSQSPTAEAIEKNVVNNNTSTTDNSSADVTNNTYNTYNTTNNTTNNTSSTGSVVRTSSASSGYATSPKTADVPAAIPAAATVLLLLGIAVCGRKAVAR